jgi:hypothetical protein
LDLGIAYFFDGCGPERFAGPHCARRDADNWNSFPDFTRAYADLDAELQEALAADGAFDQVLAEADDAESAQPDQQASASELQLLARRKVPDISGPRLRAVLEYLGLRVKLSANFSAFPCPLFLVDLQAKVDCGQALQSEEVRVILKTAASYRRINVRATPSALQACYALDIAIDRLVTQVGPSEYPSRIQEALRRTGRLSEGQDGGLRRWFERRAVRMPNTRPIVR